MNIRNNKNILFLGIIIILGILAFDARHYSSVNTELKQPKIKFSSKIDKIEINRKKEDVILVKNKRVWSVLQDNVHYPAKQEFIDKIIEFLSNFHIQDLISANKNKYASFGLEDSDDNLIKLICYQGNKEKLAIFFGKSNYAQKGDYIRIKGSDLVYLTDGIFTFNLSRPDFRDLSMTHFDENSIKKIVWHYNNNKDFVLEKNNKQVKSDNKSKGKDKDKNNKNSAETVWEITQQGKNTISADKNKVLDFISKISNLQAVDMQKIDSSKDYGFEKPFYSLDIIDTNNNLYALTFGSESDDRPAYYARISNKKDWVYLVNIALGRTELAKQTDDFIIEK